MISKFSKFCDEWSLSFNETLNANSTDIIQPFVENWNHCLSQALPVMEDVEFVEISLIRQSILDECNPYFCLELFNEQWLINGFLEDATFEIPCFSLLFKQKKRELLEEAKHYMSSIPSWIAEKIMLEKINILDKNMAKILKNNISLLICFPGLEKKIRLLISFGEYHRFQHILYEVGF